MFVRVRKTRVFECGGAFERETGLRGPAGSSDSVIGPDERWEPLLRGFRACAGILAGGLRRRGNWRLRGRRSINLNQGIC